jgi:ketosteroid isomerase-like protein
MGDSVERNRLIIISRSGDVAWFSAVYDVDLEYKGRASQVRNARYTGILEKRDGKWVIVQLHFSYPA